MAIEMKKVSAGRLRAIGYDAAARLLQVDMDDGRCLQYSGVPADIWRRLAAHASMWSYFRDTIEDEYPVRRIR